MVAIDTDWMHTNNNRLNVTRTSFVDISHNAVRGGGIVCFSFVWVFFFLFVFVVAVVVGTRR